LQQVQNTESNGQKWREEICATVTNLADDFANYCDKIAPLLMN
jgi:hypothetical protein